MEPNPLTRANSGDDDFDRAIRPKRLGDYVGQAPVREQMEIFIRAAVGREEAAVEPHELVFRLVVERDSLAAAVSPALRIVVARLRVEVVGVDAHELVARVLK